MINYIEGVEMLWKVHNHKLATPSSQQGFAAPNASKNQKCNELEDLTHRISKMSAAFAPT
jgi:hypothetical protein